MKVAEKTDLYSEHEALNAKLVEFAGYMMPLQYEGVTAEHLAVREKMGLFDVSHMGRIQVLGKQALEFFDYLGTTPLLEKQEGSCNYTVLTDKSGGAVDDCLVYIENQESVFTVVNASRKQEDLAFFREHAPKFDVKVIPCFEEGILALQGPLSKAFLPTLFPQAKDLPFMRFTKSSYEGTPFYIARAGYTGSFGYELYLPKELTLKVWRLLMEKGKPLGLKPVGLGARDTLRLEAGFALYGHELSEAICPVESVSSWTVKKDKESYLAKEAVEKVRASSNRKYQRGVILEEKGVPREGYPVFLGQEEIGICTSGNFSPIAKKGIAIVMVNQPLKPETPLRIGIRGKKILGKVVKFPFIEI